MRKLRPATIAKSRRQATVEETLAIEPLLSVAWQSNRANLGNLGKVWPATTAEGRRGLPSDCEEWRPGHPNLPSHSLGKTRRGWTDARIDGRCHRIRAPSTTHGEKNYAVRGKPPLTPISKCAILLSLFFFSTFIELVGYGLLSWVFFFGGGGRGRRGKDAGGGGENEKKEKSKPSKRTIQFESCHKVGP